MNQTIARINKARNDQRGVFGLNAVQSFFVIILSIALLAYIIVIVTGLLVNTTTTLIPQSSGTATNETTGPVNTTGVYIAQAALNGGFSNAVLTAAFNKTSGAIVGTGNFSLSSLGVLTNASTTNWAANELNVSYTYKFNTLGGNNANYILTNTSTGITGFFGSLNPVYGILAVLVIILVLVVLVRVVSTSNVAGAKGPSGPSQL